MHDNFFFRLSDLEFMDMNTWKELKLPLNLFNLLMRHIKQTQEKEKGVSNTSNSSNSNTKVVNPINTTTSNSNSNINSSNNNNNKFSNQLLNNNSNINQVKTNTNTNTNTNNTNYNNNTNSNNALYEIRYSSKETLKEDIFHLLDQVISEAKNRETFEPTLKTLFKILENILNNPSNDQFRKIKKTSNAYTSKIGILKSAEYFLYCLGFMDDGEYVFLGKPNLDNLKNALFYFESFLIKHSKNKVNIKSILKNTTTTIYYLYYIFYYTYYYTSNVNNNTHINIYRDSRIQLRSLLNTHYWSNRP